MDKKLKRLLVWLAVYLVAAIAVPAFISWRLVPPSEWHLGERVLFLFGAFSVAGIAFMLDDWL